MLLDAVIPALSFIPLLVQCHTMLHTNNCLTPYNIYATLDQGAEGDTPGAAMGTGTGVYRGGISSSFRGFMRLQEASRGYSSSWLGYK